MFGLLYRSVKSRPPVFRTIAVRVSSFEPRATMSTSRFLYEYIYRVERIERYGPGGYHPINIGDRLHDRYRVVHKLGYGSFSTIWLCRDERLSKYVAVKVATADSDPHEIYTLSRLTENESGDKALILAAHDRFSIHGPNGTHSCLVMTPASCSLSGAKDAACFGVFQLDVARSLAAQLAIAVAHVHEQGFVHGDLHLGNMLLQMPPGLDDLSEERLYDKFGEPEPEPVVRLDGKPLSPGVPSHVFSPVWMGEQSHSLILSDAKLLLTDFGVAFRPSQESRFLSHAPLYLYPPEAQFEPTKALSFASDIWGLACSIWDILGQRSLFDTMMATLDEMTCEQIDALGHLPAEWWDKWEARSKYFTEAGQPIEGRSVWTLERNFEYHIQDSRERKSGMETIGPEERDALFSMIRWMLAFRPDERPSAKQVLETAWMRDWALPEYQRIRE